MPGTGKSTLGEALARQGFNYTDLDTEVENRIGRPITDFVADAGMDAFRAVEADTLVDILGRKPAIVACGGGTPCFGNNLELMSRVGITVNLTCQLQRHIRRLMEAGPMRPMLAAIYSDANAVGDFIARLQAQRSPFYSRADRQFDASYLETQAEINATSQRFIIEILS